MTGSESTQGDASPRCKVCGSESSLFGETEVLRKHSVRYYRCASCGFIQTETPYWLEEAYSSAIARQDVGIMQRNLINQEVTAAALALLFPEIKRCVDYGAGHGIFVRLMRDRGFDFRWYDRHASNDYARGFEHEPGKHYDLLTAFEVLEHLENPIADLGEMMSISDNVLVSTALVPDPAPGLKDWWYFVPSTGQHISLYTRGALETLAKHFQRHLLSHGPYHLFSKLPRNRVLFQIATRPRVARLLTSFYRFGSKLDADFQEMTR